MTDYMTELSIDRLCKALETAFTWTIEAMLKQPGIDPAQYWADLVASGLDQVRITALPEVSHFQRPFDFVSIHRIIAERIEVLRGGMMGGPNIDLLFQLTFETEEADFSVGVPLVFQLVENTGRMPQLRWKELRDLSQRLLRRTPAGRLVFISRNGPFSVFGIRSEGAIRNRLLGAAMAQFAGLLLPPKPVSGRQLTDFCVDLASGWIGDPALGVDAQVDFVEPFLTEFNVGSILRLTISLDPGVPQPPRQQRTIL